MKGKAFVYYFIALGLVIQVVTFLITPASWLSLVSGCLGICSVCLAAQGNILTFAFGFGQVITYSILCLMQHFYAGVAINAYYFITMIYGVYVWKKRLKEKGDRLEVEPRRLPYSIVAVLLVSTILMSWLTGLGLKAWTDDTQPYIDAYTTVPALVAQVLMILAFREHWFIWLAVDILSVVLWFRAGDYCMGAQYIFWCINCLYGWRRWSLSTPSA